ncbi:uncharacterized protein V6R79_002024 [Siganus canaliculatus]
MPNLPLVYTEWFHPPLTEDVEELLAHFQQADSVRYEHFSAIWRDLSFSDVFLGIPRMNELNRFCRITLATAVKYFLPPYAYQIRVGGLYLMFAFYSAQLASPPLKIRIPLRDWDVVQTFVKNSLDSGHLDVVYIYHKLLAAKAIHFTAMPHFLTFRKHRKPKKDPVCAEFLGRTTAVQELLSSDILEEMNNLHIQYDKLKEATTEVGREVNMVQRDFLPRLKDCMSEFLTWQQKTFPEGQKDQNSGEEGEEGDEEEMTAKASKSRAQLLSAIKQKSYRSNQEAAKSRRHRQTEVVESSSSGPEQVQQAAARKKRPVSLRARTQKSLGVVKEEKVTQTWLLSAPEIHHSAA